MAIIANKEKPKRIMVLIIDDFVPRLHSYGNLFAPFSDKIGCTQAGDIHSAMWAVTRDDYDYVFLGEMAGQWKRMYSVIMYQNPKTKVYANAMNYGVRQEMVKLGCLPAVRDTDFILNFIDSVRSE